jgi:PilZ domain
MNETDRKTNVAIRQDVRYPQLCELSMMYEGATEDVSVRPPDLSPHGMFINTRSDYPEGAVLKLRFRLSRTGVLVQTRSEVRYCLKGVGIGVEFVDVTPETTRAIEKEISLQAIIK